MVNVVAVMLLLGVSAEASSSSVSICAPLASVSSKVKDCESNEYFAEAAVRCLNKVEARIKEASKVLQASLVKPKSAKDAKQAQSFDSSEKNYKMADATLKSLIAMATAARAEVKVYSESFAPPEDFDSEEFVGNDVDGFLKNSACFSEPLAVTESVLEDFDYHLDSLAAAQKGAALRDTVSGGRESRTDTLGAEDAPKPSATGKVTPPSVGPPRKKVESGVSGAEESKKKRLDLE